MTRMRVRGTPIDRRFLAREASVVGNLLIEEVRDDLLGRTIRQARFMPALPKDGSAVSPLLCVELLWMGHDGFVLGGLERTGGADIAQN